MRVFGQHRARFEAFERGQASRDLDREANRDQAGRTTPTGPSAAQLLDRMPAQQRQAIERRHRPLRHNEGLSFRVAHDGLVLVRQRGRDLTVHPDGSITRGWPTRTIIPAGARHVPCVCGHGSYTWTDGDGHLPAGRVVDDDTDGHSAPDECPECARPIVPQPATVTRSAAFRQVANLAAALGTTRNEGDGR